MPHSRRRQWTAVICHFTVASVRSMGSGQDMHQLGRDGRQANGGLGGRDACRVLSSKHDKYEFTLAIRSAKRWTYLQH